MFWYGHAWLMETNTFQYQSHQAQTTILVALVESPECPKIKQQTKTLNQYNCEFSYDG